MNQTHWGQGAHKHHATNLIMLKERCPNLIDTDGDGEADAPYENPYANTTSRYYDAPIGGNVKVEGSLS